MRIGRVYVVQGGQYGSESKGMVAAQYARAVGVDNVIRTGSINAGHTVYVNKNKYVFQQLPTASVYPKYRPIIYIGPGAYIHKPTLDAEVKMVEEVDPNFRKRLFIDHRATMHTDDHIVMAKEANRHVSMGATGKGCAEVMIQKIKMRGSSPQPALASDRLLHEYNLVELSEHIQGSSLIEGTQGAELDVHLGPYPYVTSRMTSSAAWVAESGLPCTDVEVVLVFRSFPIRVAGNSGPMDNEISWVELADEINHKRAMAQLPPIVSPEAINAFIFEVQRVSKGMGVDGNSMHKLTGSDRVKHRDALSEVHAAALRSMPNDYAMELKKLFEFTTVTKKLRRIARFDMESFCRVVDRENPSTIVFTFMNYLFPDGWFEPSYDARNRACEWIRRRAPNNVEVGYSFNPYGYTTFTR